MLSLELGDVGHVIGLQLDERPVFFRDYPLNILFGQSIGV